MDERQAKELGQKLRERRESLGMSLRQLEEKSGVFNVTIKLGAGVQTAVKIWVVEE